MKTIAATLALIALLYIAATAGRVEGQVAQYLKPQPFIERKDNDMINYSHTLPDGGTITLTMTKPDSQTWEAFSAEAAAAWAAVKAANGI